MKIYHKIFAVMFLAVLVIFSVLNFSFKFLHIKRSLSEIEKPEELKNVKQYTAEVDSALTNNLLFDHNWNEIYAMTYNVLGKNEENSFKYVRDKNGMLYQGNFWNTSSVPTKEYIDRINRIKATVSDKGTKVVVLLYPSLYDSDWSDGYYGIPYTNYETVADEMTSYFRYYGINYICYRDFFKEQGKEATDIFYKTDHHWTIEAAFEGYQELVRYLNEECGEELNTFYADKNNYTYTTYEDCFIGSQGRDAGTKYVGLDDFTYVVPKFETDYTYSATFQTDNVNVHRGPITETLISYNKLEEKDYYQKDMYSTYLNGVVLRDDITNHNNPEGLKVLFIRDSFSSPLATFFSSHCSQMCMMWSANVPTETMEAEIVNGDYDYIFIGLAVDSYVNGAFEIFVEGDANE